MRGDGAADDGFETLFRLSPVGIVITSAEGVVLDVNDSGARLIECERDELIGRPTAELGIVPPGVRDELVARVRSGAQVRDVRLEIRTRSGAVREVLLSMQTLEVRGSTRLISTLLDMTDRRRADANFAALVESLDDGVVGETLDGTVTSWNPAAERIFGYRAEEMIGKPFTILCPPGDEAIHLEVVQRVGRGERVRRRAVVRRRKDGSDVVVAITASPVRGLDGTIVMLSNVMRDLTQERNTAREKEILLQEVHHRVKNNLQVIASLINMQRRRLENPEARSALEQCQTRVLAIAAIHEKLYQSKDYARVPFSEYIRSLASNVFQATGAASTNVRLALEIEPLTLPVDKAIPCGLIVNELITNALKHAFPGGRAGTIRVGLAARGGRVSLTVADDGVGVPAELDIARSTTLGLQLVSTLVAQLGAKFEIDRGTTDAPGTTFRTSFEMEA